MLSATGHPVQGATVRSLHAGGILSLIAATLLAGVAIAWRRIPHLILATLGANLLVTVGWFVAFPPAVALPFALTMVTMTGARQADRIDAERRSTGAGLTPGFHGTGSARSAPITTAQFVTVSIAAATCSLVGLYSEFDPNNAANDHPWRGGAVGLLVGLAIGAPIAWAVGRRQRSR